ncbi:TonB-dependent receptor [Sphingomonas sp. RHCKR7]|uniref:TonB-dependent receptor n=1 Tax=Sphingomonas folli TaxID=2862497 RepID=UPI001C66FA49|nr:TonB-dependent receptor [Sphingomonas folli]MBW6527825.1 TonB-dependent receptor [Sphingomonas folli]
MRKRYFGASALAAITIALAAGTAQAQEAGGGDQQPLATPTSAGVDNDVVVTARKRSETVQTMADPVSVISEAAIQNADLRTLQDAVRLTPNLVVLDGLYPGYKTVSFRGFTTLGRDGEFPFATIVDGVVQPGQMFFQQELVNVQQIEVLRGPQGTLYGGGAIAGAINIVTKQPTDEFEGSATAAWLSGDEKRVNLNLSGPLIADKLYFQAGATAYDFDGLIDNVAINQKADFARALTSRSSLVWAGTPDFRAALTLSTTDSKVGGLWLAPVADELFDEVVAPVSENQLGIVRTKLRALSLKMDYTISDFATLTSITANSYGRDYTTADGDFSAADTYTQNVRFIDKAWSQEVRLTSDGTGPFKWNVGAFYQDETRNQVSNYGSVGNPPDFFSQNDDEREYRTFALFGQASYAFTDRLEFTGGFRYDWERQRLTDQLANQTFRQTFSEPQGKASLSYKVSPSLFTYASYSRGYRKGGFNPRSIAALLSYDPETADNYELGFKSDFADRRVTFNGAVFYTDFNGQLLQTSRVLPGQGIYIAISNIEKTKVFGFEAETTIRPLDGFSISGSVGYSDVKIKQFLPEDRDAFRDNRTPQIYGLTLQGSLDVDRPLGGGFSLVAHGDVTHRGDVYWDVENSLRTSPRTFLNAKIGIRRDNWTLSFVGRNITDERTPAAVGPHALGTTSLVSYNEPAQYGAQLGVQF